MEAIDASLADLAERPDFSKRPLARALAAESEPDIAVALPHDVYDLALETFEHSPGLTAAELVGRRCLVTSDGAPVATLELPDPDGARGVVTTHGPFTEATAEALRAAEDSGKVADGDYDLRLLRIPALYLMSLWLKDQQGKDDVFIPLAPAPAGLDGGAIYNWDEMRSHLAGLAEQRLATSEDETPGPEVAG
ncbi:MAG TPA: hypothetical protein VFT19_03945 [Solirubrobacterales bacterium]|nr:hypothetical protein [Solirubrobacterales bacterium]